LYINGILSLEGGIPKVEKIKQHLQMLRVMNLKPNFSELVRIYGIDRRKYLMFVDEQDLIERSI